MKLVSNSLRKNLFKKINPSNLDGFIQKSKAKNEKPALSTFNRRYPTKNIFICWNDRWRIISIQQIYRYKYQYPIVLLFIKIFLTKNSRKLHLIALHKEDH